MVWTDRDYRTDEEVAITVHATHAVEKEAKELAVYSGSLAIVAQCKRLPNGVFLEYKALAGVGRKLKQCQAVVSYPSRGRFAGMNMTHTKLDETTFGIQPETYDYTSPSLAIPTGAVVKIVVTQDDNQQAVHEIVIP